MPPEDPYSLSDLVALTGVTTRTIRYYIAMGLLPSPGQTGPGARYSEGHLIRLRLIKQLQRDRFPLADIRGILAGLTDADIVAMLEESPGPRPPASAKDYIRGVLGATQSSDQQALYLLSPPSAPSPGPATRSFSRDAGEDAPGTLFLRRTSEPPAETPSPDRSQWDRIVLARDVELHVRRPLGRHQHRLVEKLIAIARQVLEEE
jgi:DNA-binding transcriptional MerR regulator